MRDVLYALLGAAIIAGSAASKGRDPLVEGLFAFVVFWLIAVAWRSYRERHPKP